MEFCYKTADIWSLIGKIVLILKIIIPIIIIVIGSIDLGKSVISSDEKAIRKSSISLAKRIIAGILIFFIPAIVNLLFNIVSGFNSSIKSDYNNCLKCITSPYNGCDTSHKNEIFPD